MTAIIIFLSPLDKAPKLDSENSLVGMLTTLFQKVGINTKQKMNKLQESYDIPMTVNLEKAVNQMCNYGDAIEGAITRKVTREVTREVTKEVTRKITTKMSEELALNMMADNEPINKILKYSKLALSKIQELAKQNGYTLVNS